MPTEDEAGEDETKSEDDMQNEERILAKLYQKMGLPLPESDYKVLAPLVRPICLRAAR